MSRRYTNPAISPLRDYGLVEFAADSPGARTTLRDAVYELARADNLPLALKYDNQEQLLQLISKLQRLLQRKDAEGIRCRISYEIPSAEVREAAADDNQGWVPLASLFAEVGGRCVADFILHQLFTAYLQPVVQPNGTIVGYEFLMRPLPELPPFRPAELFEAARSTGQHAFLDRAARLYSIRMGASHLQQGMKRFINFLPSSLHCPDRCLKGTFDMMKETGTNPEDCVFEVMETERLDAPGLKNVFDVYRKEGVRLALDDVGTGFATLDAVNWLEPDYVKMDRKWVSGCDQNANKQRYIDRLLERVSRFHGVVLAEGVEREEEWNYLRRAGVPLFQGYLFGKASPVPAKAAVLA